jgi:hypothetical protein
MPITKYPKHVGDYDEDGIPDEQDPLDALSTFLSGTSPYPELPTSGAGNRNQALAAGIAAKYKIPSLADGSVSQADLEALDRFMTGDAIREKVAPVQVQGEYGLKNRQLANQGALDTENLKGGYGLQEQQLKNQGLEAVAGAKQKAAAAGPDQSTIDYLAAQSGRDAATLTKIPMAMRQAVLAKMAQNGVDVNTMTNQTRQMSETANDLLPMIDNIQRQASDLKASGNFDLLHSPLRQFLVKHGAGSLLGYGDDAAKKVGQFQTDMGLLQSGVARAHAGARGAGNSEIAARFEQLMNAGGDLPTFLGELQGVRDLLTTYAQHTNPNIGAAADDPYANPDYQPR